jgi:hypothetical protein
VKRHSYLFPSFAVGKWSQVTCRVMIDDFSKRVRPPTANNKLTIFTDGNDDYEYVLPEFFEPSAISYGQMIKIREKGRVVDKIKRAVFGTPEISNIETTDVENFNGILRAGISRLVRKTKCISKTVEYLEYSISLFQFYWNFAKPLHGNKTPAMEEGIADHVWTWEEFLLWRIKPC